MKKAKFQFVKNKNKHVNANEKYGHLWIEGDFEYLFTNHDMKQARERAGKNREDLSDMRSWWEKIKGKYILEKIR